MLLFPARAAALQIYGTRAQKVAPARARRLAFYAVRRFCQYPLVALALLPLL